MKTIKMTLNQESKENAYVPTLTSRENEVLLHVSKGMKNYQIASELSISEHTVRVHRRNLYCKLKVSKPAGAVMKGFQLGYLSI